MPLMVLVIVCNKVLLLLMVREALLAISPSAIPSFSIGDYENIVDCTSMY